MNHSSHLCAVPIPHTPHCTVCNTPVKIGICEYEDETVIFMGACENGCTPTTLCDGRLHSVLGEGRILSQQELPEFCRGLVEHITTKVDQCLHSSNCNAMPIRAHTISRSWLTHLGESHVFLFRQHPRNAIRPAGHPSEIPHKVAIKKATITRFCCSDHDKIFHPVDSRTSCFESRNHLHLLFYRALLCKLHNSLVCQQLLDTPFGKNIIHEKLEVHLDIDCQVELYSHACKRLRQTLATENGNWRIKHIRKYIDGKPAIACSNAGYWVSNLLLNTSTLTPDAGLALGVWGITVIPQEEGHVIVYHYCTLDRDIRIAKSHLAKMSRELSFLNELEGDNLASAISKNLTVMVENLCVSPEVWNSFSEKKRRVIKNAWLENSYVPSGQFASQTLDGIPLTRQHLVNFF